MEIKNLFKKFRNYGNDCTLGFGKELFLSLLIFGLIGLGSFCNASEFGYFESNIRFGNNQVISVDSGYCYMFSNSNQFEIVDGNYNFTVDGTSGANYGFYCFENNGTIKSINSTVYLRRIKSTDFFTCPICDYSDYVPVSDYNTCLSDLNTATGNYLSCQSSISGYENSLNNCSSNLNSCNTSLSSCLSANCPNNTGNISRSALFINNIQHIGAPVIRMTIPEEFDRDYSYTDSGNNMEINIEGYNVDTEYISSIIDVQRSKPSTEDFNSIISDVLPLFVPGLVIILFIYFVFKLIKKIF